MLENIGRNNFDILRIVLAIVVYLYHIGVLVDVGFLKLFPGEYAVQCFFVISGFLITRSYLRNRNKFTYFKSRFLRIYPLYALVITLSFFIGIFITDMSYFDYYSSGVYYLLYNLIFLNFLQPDLPGVFQNFTINAVNGSLWTIKIEVMFYILVPIIYSVSNNIKQVKLVTATTFLISIFSILALDKLISHYSLPESLKNQLPSQLCFFMVGAYFNFIKLSRIRVVSLILVLAFLYIVAPELIFIPPIIIGFLVYIFAFHFPIIEVSDKIGDLSYGIYIWHFPVIQSFKFFGLYEDKLEGIVLSSITVFLLSYISWHRVEKRILSK